jgi:hypothetical protein
VQLATVAGEPCLHVDASDHTQQPAVRGGDHCDAQLAAAEPLRQFAEGTVGSDGGRASLHDVLRPRRRITIRHLLAEPPEQRRVLGDDQREPVRRARHPRRDRPDGLLGPGGHRVATQHVLDARDLRLLPFGR